MKSKLKSWNDEFLFFLIRSFSYSVYTKDWEHTPCLGREMLNLFSSSVGLERQKSDTWGDKLRRQRAKSGI